MANHNIIRFTKALWDTTKGTPIITMVFALLIMIVPQTFNSTFTDGTGVDITPEETTIFLNYHVAFIACCVMASFGRMAFDDKLLLRFKITFVQEWIARWLLFVLLPIVFFVAIVHLFDYFDNDSPYITYLFGVKLFNQPECYTLPLFFFGTSFFFLVSTFFKRFSFFFGVLILCFGIVIKIVLQPKGGFSFEAKQAAALPVISFVIVLSVLFLVLSYYRLLQKRKKQTATAP